MCVCTHGRDKYNYHRYNTHTRTPQIIYYFWDTKIQKQ